MKNLPKVIYLQIGDDVLGDEDFNDCTEVTWCADKIHDNDIRYVLDKRQLKRGEG